MHQYRQVWAFLLLLALAGAGRSNKEASGGTPAPAPRQSGQAATETESAAGGQEVAEELRVGGDYRVESISRSGSGGFEIIFTAQEPSGRFDRLIFRTDHVHLGIENGQVLRISADINRTANPAEAEIAQLVLFLKSPEGPTPVWMLSRDLAPAAGAERLKGYLKMHAPQSDFMVF